jgi:hypothetical protein
MYSLVSVHDCTVRCGERSELVVNNTPVENVLTLNIIRVQELVLES